MEIFGVFALQVYPIIFTLPFVIPVPGMLHSLLLRLLFTSLCNLFWIQICELRFIVACYELTMVIICSLNVSES